MSAPTSTSTAPRGVVARSKDFFSHAAERAASYFRERDPTVRAAFGPFLVLSAFLYVRSPFSNYIFDEQEALLANPFVNGKVPFRDVLTRDFWGLPHDRSIGSYRPLPNVIWRGFWKLGTAFHYPWALHWINIVIHALNAACVARIALGLTRNRSAGWFAGLTFATCAVLTEAVTGVVGIADVLGALGLLLAVLSLEASLPKMAPLVFATVTLGLFSKESTLVALPILCWIALVAAPIHHPLRPRRVPRALVALLCSALALALYTQTRRHFFPTDLPDDLKVPLASSAPWFRRGFRAFLVWFQQPRLPQDPINNPLVRADMLHRVSGALGVYASGVGQVLFPFTLSGDYSYAAEPIPEHVMNVRAVVGAALLLAPPLAGVSLWLSALASEFSGLLEQARARIVVAITLIWVPVAYFPHSNIPILLPTVRAERFWYLPAAGMALALGVLFAWLCRQPRERFIGQFGPAFVALFLGFQAARGRVHALDYSDDLVFWRATSRAVPRSAKAHLNYGVMLGARGKLLERLAENRRAMAIAGTWPMAHIYYADTLCRLNRVEEAWPDYVTGAELAPNDRNLLALALQCVWDHGAIPSHETELLSLAADHPGTWLAYLARDLVSNGQKNGGIDRKYRPRGYDEGPGD